MDSTAVKLILDKLELFGQQLGMAGRQLLPYFIKQVYLDFAIAGLLALFGWLMFSIFFRIGRPIYQKYIGNSWDDRPVLVGMGLVIWGMACVGATVATIVLGCRLLNVEYWALQKALALI